MSAQGPRRKTLNPLSDLSERTETPSKPYSEALEKILIIDTSQAGRLPMFREVIKEMASPPFA